MYLLGHEELQTRAVRYLGNQVLATHQDRLHDWAAAYRAKDWPAESPEYLLSGYYQLLTDPLWIDLADLPHIAALATDATRHDRMLDLTGGDAAALTEIRTASTSSPPKTART